MVLLLPTHNSDNNPAPLILSFSVPIGDVLPIATVSWFLGYMVVPFLNHLSSVGIVTTKTNGCISSDVMLKSGETILMTL